MTADWDRIERAFHEATALPACERERYLDKMFTGEPNLRAQVVALLEADAAADAGSSIAEPALGHEFRLPEPESLIPDGIRRHPERIGPYHVQRIIGEGGMGAVYLAQRDDGEFEQTVAIKLISSPFPTAAALTRFRRERQTLANLNHPNIARLLEGGTTSGGLPYLVMEYVEGKPIDEYCRARRLSVRERLQLFLIVCEAVQHAHQNLVIHRDLKPRNILVTADGTPKLLDFGIAKGFHVALQSHHPVRAAPTVTMLTPAYASPEQLRHDPITTATDVYALGVILYELLTGVRPYESDSRSAAQMEQLIDEHPPTRPSSVVRRVEREFVTGAGHGDEQTRSSLDPHLRLDPRRWRRQLEGDLDTIAMMALRREPDRRYQTAEQLADDIRRHLAAHPIRARRDTVGYRAGRFVRRNWAMVSLATASVLVLLGALVATSWLAHARAVERNLALEARAAEQQQRRRAEAAERHAASEAGRARAVSDFLIGLFEVADPYEGPGPDTTALDLVERGAQRIETELAEQPRRQAMLLGTLGEVYANLGMPRKAEQLLQQAVVLDASAGDVLDVSHARLLNALADVRSSLGSFESAKAELHCAIAVLDHLPDDFPHARADVLQSLAAVEISVGAYDDAMTRLEEALALVSGSTMGAASAAEIRHTMARVEFERGDYRRAETHARDALRLYQSSLPGGHPQLASVMQDLGAILHMQGRLDEAEHRYRKALTALKMRLDRNHPGLLHPLSNLAGLALDRGDVGAAERMYQQVLAIQRGVYGEAHPSIGATVRSLGIVADARDDVGVAETRLRKALDIYRSTLPADHLDIALTLSLLGDVLAQNGRPDEGEPLLRESLVIRERALSDDHWQAAISRSMLGDCLTAAGRFDEAEPLLLQSLEIITDTFGHGHEQTRLAANRVIRFHEAIGKPERAQHARSLLEANAAADTGSAGAREAR